MAQKQFQDPFVKLFGSLSRVRLLRLFLLNPNKTYSISEASERSRIDAREVRRELDLLAEAGLLRKNSGKHLRFSVDEKFPFFDALQQMLLYAPLRGKDIYDRVRTMGVIKLIVLSGIFVGEFDGKLDILVVGEKLNEKRLRSALKALEADLGVSLRFSSLTTTDFLYRLTISDRFVRDVFDYPHRIIFDKLDIGLK